MMEGMKNNLILLYDGDCGFCNHSVNFILKHEKNSNISFATLKSNWVKQYFEEKKLDLPDGNSLVFITENQVFDKSSAVVNIARQLNPPISWVSIIRFLPKRFCDACYDFIAKRRNRISKGFCVLPSAEQKLRFLN
jgi:predicted DCC family thiol-disulfide oxidoreductase YuxK